MTDENTVQYRLDFADAGFAITNNEFGDDDHRELLRLVASEHLTADEAVAVSCDRHGVWIDHTGEPPVVRWEDYEFSTHFALKSRVRDATDSSMVSSPERLRAVELDLSRLRMVELAITPVQGQFDFTHFAEVHRRLFSDIYPWAGQQRVGPQTAMTRFAPETVGFAPATRAPPWSSTSTRQDRRYRRP